MSSKKEFTKVIAKGANGALIRLLVCNSVSMKVLLGYVLNYSIGPIPTAFFFYLHGKIVNVNKTVGDYSKNGTLDLAGIAYS